MLWKNPKTNSTMKNIAEVSEPYHVCCVTVNQQWNGVNESQTEKSLLVQGSQALNNMKMNYLLHDLNN